MANKDSDILELHPEFLEKARSLFTYDKTPVIQESVPRGDERHPSLNPNEITGEDIESLAKFAAGIVDARIAQLQAGDSKVSPIAIDDATLRAVNEMDNGKFSGRVSEPTMTLIRQKASEIAEKKKAPKATDLNEKLSDMAIKGQEEAPGEWKSDEPGTYVEPRIEDPESPNNGPKIMKEAAKKEAPKARAESVVETLAKPITKTEVKGLANDIRNMGVTEKKNVKKVVDALSKKKAADMTAILDKIAGLVEAKGMKHLASDLDIVSNTLDRMASDEQD